MTSYKDSLHLPKTDFPMKAGWGEREPEFLRQWEAMDLYRRLLEKNKKGERFIFHDGPPYANGHLHYGTILNKILKDIVVKYKNMSGAPCPFIPGWDCHGLPIEHEVDKQLGKKKRELTPLKIREACREYAGKFVEIQREEFKRLGCLGEWANPYLTMSPDYEALIVREFGRLFKTGGVYRGMKPVFWCPSCATALAEAEVEYAPHTSPSIYVKFRLKPDKDLWKRWGLPPSDPIFLVIWTTTPWTLPANLGICLHPQLTYEAVRIGGEVYVIAKARLNAFLEAMGSPECDVVTHFTGQELERRECEHPFLDRASLIMLGPHVTTEVGTGCVHTAPGHGQEDYVVGAQYGIRPLSPVDAHGRFTQEAGVKEAVGKKVEEANEILLELLKARGALLKEERLEHSYPHCWRCKKPVIFRATEQWFVSMEEKELRKKSLLAINLVEWIPEWGKNRIQGMVENRPDWCLSRQRLWGVPIVAFTCKGCGATMSRPEWIESAAELFEKHPAGADAWYEQDGMNIPAPGEACPECRAKKGFEKGMDILDVWFDSGVSFAYLLEKREKTAAKADLYLEGSDQHRGWFHTSLLASMATRGRAPYKAVLTHGFVVDQEGKKLSKSAKNYVPPDSVLKKHGAELLRFWVANEDYRNDIRFSEDLLVHLADSYRKIRNTCRYMLGNLYDFSPGKDEVAHEKLEEIDRWALHALGGFIAEVEERYARYEFHQISQLFTRFCSVELSSFYFDILKDRLYTEAASGKLRRSAQTVLHTILSTFACWMAPILSFTAEDVWKAAPAHPKKPESVFLAPFPKGEAEWKDDLLGERWERFMRIREAATKALENARAAKFVGNSLEARLTVEGKPDQLEFLKSFGEGLADLFIVSEVVFESASGDWVFQSPNMPGLKVGVAKAAGKKCARCWKYAVTVGKEKAHPEVCARCARVLEAG